MYELLVTIGGSYLIFFLAALAALYLLLQPRERLREGVLVLAGAFALTYLFGELASQLYSHPQPYVTGGFEPIIPHVPDNAFPSDHALFSGALAGALFFYHRSLGFLLLLGAIITGASRIAGGVHAPVDIAAGIVIGLAGAALAHALVPPLMRKWYTFFNKTNDSYE